MARCKKLDERQLKLVQAGMTQDTGFDALDLSHISLLNERIDTYLKTKELRPREILELVQAKFHIMSCLKMSRDRKELDELF